MENTIYSLPDKDALYHRTICEIQNNIVLDMAQLITGVYPDIHFSTLMLHIGRNDKVNVGIWLAVFPLADINQPLLQFNCSILMHAIAHKCDIEIIKMLINRGAEINWCDNTASILFYACAHSTPEIVEYLIDNNADVYYANKYKITIGFVVFKRNCRYIKNSFHLKIHNDIIKLTHHPSSSQPLQPLQPLQPSQPLQLSHPTDISELINNQQEIPVSETIAQPSEPINLPDDSSGSDLEIDYNEDIPRLLYGNFKNLSLRKIRQLLQIRQQQLDAMLRHRRNRMDAMRGSTTINEMPVVYNKQCTICRTNSHQVQKVFCNAECPVCLEESDILWRFSCGHLGACNSCIKKIK